MYHKPPLQIMKGDCRLRLQDTAEIPRGWRRRPGKEKHNMHRMRGYGKTQTQRRVRRRKRDPKNRDGTQGLKKEIEDREEKKAQRRETRAKVHGCVD
jgi:hypothetical protein